MPEIEKIQSPEVEAKTQAKLLDLIKDEAFFNELVEKVEELQKAGIKEKNIIKGSLTNIKRIRIGDKIYSPDETYNRKNIVIGDIKGADELIIGDGH